MNLLRHAIKYKLQNTNKYIRKHRTAGQRLKSLALTELHLKLSFWSYTQDAIF